MSSHTLPGMGLKGGRAAGESGWAAEMNLNLLTLSAIGQLGAKSRVTALPGSPTDGDIYIVPSSDPTNPNKVAVRDAGAWVYLPPVAGWRAYVVDEGLTYLWNGTSWVINPEPFDLSMFVPGSTTASEKVLNYLFARTVMFPDDFAGALARAGTAATESTTFDIQKNGVSIGSLVFAASGITGTFTTAGTGTVSFVAGDILTLVAPASPDATLADISITFVGKR